MKVRKFQREQDPGQRGFVGGSMGDFSVIIEGCESPESKISFSSTVHGAGRVMGRRQAKGKKGQKGLVTRKMMQDWIEPMGIELRGAGVDEAPHCYKRLPDVLSAHASSIRILHTLTPVGVAMAGPEQFDPYKD